jgi:hypothetical protein
LILAWLIGALPDAPAALLTRPWAAWAATARTTTAIGWAAGATATWLGKFSVRADAHVIDVDDIDQRADALCIVQRRIGEMRPDSD